ncbi:putative ibr finger domain protein [Diplodia seriata]|uniref:RBR-type E3 ubiquitin transferase n=1 Tax=Diplodia seriata TaxID=420778 RepID=A0A0G2EJL4_9PEZI|nr:putative ibr finger domain protein [Diplodia seriata]
MSAMETDDETTALILRLLSKDLAVLLAGVACKDNGNNEVANDLAYAHRLYEQEIEAQEMILSDRRMGKSIQQAVQTDGHTINVAKVEEDTATRDHNLALEYPSADNDEDGDTATAGESSTQGAIRNKGKGVATTSADDNPRPTHRTCIACCSSHAFFDIATLPGCHHDYCRDCLDQLFRLSLTDESIFPPRCCRKPIPFEDVRILLYADTARDFERKRPELETPDRTYCCQPLCATWIPPAAITQGGKVGTCPSCATRTCAVCKAEAHDGEDCPEDETTKSLLSAVEENKWQRCYSCKRFVELNTGCYHITYVTPRSF